MNEYQVGIVQYKRSGDEFTLLPIGHSTQVAHIEVLLSKQGDILSADVISEKGTTVIPITEPSLNRTSNLVAHPLHDKLMYVAGDFFKYTGLTKKEKGYALHQKDLETWCKSEYADENVLAVYQYLQKGTLIEDLIKCEILHLDDEGMLMTKWVGDKKSVPSIFSVVTNQQDAFVRFNVENEENIPLWNNKTFINNYIAYVESQLEEKDLCYITGEYVPTSQLQPSKLRFTSDKAKLISVQAKHKLGFLGRFIDSTDLSVLVLKLLKKHTML